MRNNKNQSDYRMLNEPIQLVSTKAYTNNNVQMGDSTFHFEDTETQENVFQSWKDDTKACRCQVLKFIFAAVITVGYFGHSMMNYMNPTTNSITRSSVIKVTEVTVPLFYFYAGYKISNLDISYIQNGDKKIEYNDIIVADATDFHYDETVDQWTLVYFGTEGWIILLVPPYGSQLKFKDILRFSLLSYTPITDGAFDGKDTEENLLKQLFDGNDYGIFWTADTPQRMGEIFNISWMQSLYDRDNLQYSFVSTTNAIQLSLTEEIDEITKPKSVDYYYTTSSVASLFESNQTTMTYKDLDDHYGSDSNSDSSSPSTTESPSNDVTSSASTTEYESEQNQNYSNFNRRFLSETTGVSGDKTHCYKYTNDFLFYYSPKGGGMKTEIVTSKLISFTDVLAATGGIWGPTTTFLSIVLSLLLTKCCAKRNGLDKEGKVKVALYLQELGVITSKQVKDSIKFKAVMNK